MTRRGTVSPFLNLGTLLCKSGYIDLHLYSYEFALHWQILYLDKALHSPVFRFNQM